MAKLVLGTRRGRMAEFAMTKEQLRQRKAAEKRRLAAQLRGEAMRAQEMRRARSAQLERRQKEFKETQAFREEQLEFQKEEALARRLEAQEQRRELRERAQRGRAYKTAQMQAEFGITMDEGEPGAPVRFRTMSEEEMQEQFGEGFVPFGLRPTPSATLAAKTREELATAKATAETRAQQAKLIGRLGFLQQQFPGWVHSNPGRADAVAMEYLDDTTPDRMMTAVQEWQARDNVGLGLLSLAANDPQIGQWAQENVERVTKFARYAAENELPHSIFMKRLTEAKDQDALADAYDNYTSTDPVKRQGALREFQRQGISTPEEAAAKTLSNQMLKHASTPSLEERRVDGKIKAVEKQLEQAPLNRTLQGERDQLYKTLEKLRETRQKDLVNLIGRLPAIQEEFHKRTVGGAKTEEEAARIAGTLIDELIAVGKQALFGPGGEPAVVPEGDTPEALPAELAKEGAPAAEAKAAGPDPVGLEGATSRIAGYTKQEQELTQRLTAVLDKIYQVRQTKVFGDPTLVQLRKEQSELEAQLKALDYDIWRERARRDSLMRRNKESGNG